MTVNIIISHVDIKKSHVDIIMLHVDINKSHVDIIMLHVDINKSHVNIVDTVCLRCKGMKYASIIINKEVQNTWYCTFQYINNIQGVIDLP